MIRFARFFAASLIFLPVSPVLAASHIDCVLGKLNNEEVRDFISAATGEGDMPESVGRAAMACVNENGWSQDAMLEAMNYSILAAMYTDAQIRLDLSGISKDDVEAFLGAIPSSLAGAITGDEEMTDEQGKILASEMEAAGFPVTDETVADLVTAISAGIRMERSKSTFEAL